MQDSWNVISVVFVGLCLFHVFYEWMEHRRATKNGVGQKLTNHDTKENDENKTRQIRDHQFNMGRRILNLLKAQEKLFNRLGVRINEWSVVDDNERFVIDFTHGTGKNAGSILQLTLDFVGRFGGKGNASIHYGAYGSTVYFDVTDQAPDHFIPYLVWPYLRLYEQPEAKTL